MKLRKALEKAKQMRGEDYPHPLTEGKPLIAVTRRSDRQWRPPEYTQSSSMPVQSQTLMANRCVCIEPDSTVLEAYKVLRTRIQLATKTHGWNNILITSPNPGDGKTLTAINLALTFAKAYNQTVMLVDCDLRRQSIHRMLGLNSSAGLVDFLVDDEPLKELIIWPGVTNLTLISGGRTIRQSAEVLGSARMKSLVQELKTRYDDRFIIFDTPPILSGADTMSLAQCVDGILMVVKERSTRLSEIKKSIDMIPKDKFLGYVMNFQREAVKAYYY